MPLAAMASFVVIIAYIHSAITSWIQAKVDIHSTALKNALDIQDRILREQATPDPNDGVLADNRSLRFEELTFEDDEDSSESAEEEDEEGYPESIPGESEDKPSLWARLSAKDKL